MDIWAYTAMSVLGTGIVIGAAWSHANGSIASALAYLLKSNINILVLFHSLPF
jgi:hypothetical protein